MTSRIAAVIVLVGVAAVVGLAWVVAPEPQLPSSGPLVAVDGGEEDVGDTPSDTAGAEPSTSTTESPASTEPVDAIPVLGPAPAITAADGWLQSDIESLDALRGNVVIVQFWTFACSNCKATLPHLQDIYSRYRDQGLEIVGVHAPEFEFEKDPAAVAAAAQDLGITWPIALDTDRADFHTWQDSPRFWPRTYVVDATGRIRFDHIGEGAYDDLEATVAALLDEA